MRGKPSRDRVMVRRVAAEYDYFVAGSWDSIIPAASVLQALDSPPPEPADGQVGLEMAEKFQIDEILPMDEVVEEGQSGEILDDAFVGDHGGVEFVAELVEDDAGAG